MLNLDDFISSLLTKPRPRQRKSPWRVDHITLRIIHQECTQCSATYTSVESPPLTTFTNLRTGSLHSIADHPAALQAALPRKLTHTTQHIPTCPACFTTQPHPEQHTLDLKPTFISQPTIPSRGEGCYAGHKPATSPDLTLATPGPVGPEDLTLATLTELTLEHLS